MHELYARAIEAFRSFAAREDGQGMVEYGLILGLVSVVAILALTAVGTDVRDALQDVADALV